MIYTLTLNPAVDRELTVPEIAFDSVLRSSQSRIDYGGKGFNVSRMLQGLGMPSTAVGFLGGKAGEVLQDGLRGLGIGVDFVWVEGETRTNISVVTPAGGHYLKVNEPGPTITAADQARLLGKIGELARAGDWWVLAGSSPPGVPEDFYARIIHLLNQAGAKTVLDTSGAELRLGCQAGPFLVKPNREEAAALTGFPIVTTADATRAAVQTRRLGAENVIISLGKAGALLHIAQAAWLAQSPRIVEKNPIGAGDSLIGGVIWALEAGKSMEAALGWGVACGAVAASLSGTEVGAREKIEALHQQVKLEVLFS